MDKTEEKAAEVLGSHANAAVAERGFGKDFAGLLSEPDYFARLPRHIKRRIGNADRSYKRRQKTDRLQVYRTYTQEFGETLQGRRKMEGGRQSDKTIDSSYGHQTTKNERGSAEGHKGLNIKCELRNFGGGPMDVLAPSKAKMGELEGRSPAEYEEQRKRNHADKDDTQSNRRQMGEKWRKESQYAGNPENSTTASVEDRQLTGSNNDQAQRGRRNKVDARRLMDKKRVLVRNAVKAWTTERNVRRREMDNRGWEKTERNVRRKRIKNYLVRRKKRTKRTCWTKESAAGSGNRREEGEGVPVGL